MRESLKESSERLEFAGACQGESTVTLGHFSSRLGVLHEQALVGFHTQLDDVLSLHRNELHRRSESIFEEIRRACAARSRRSASERGENSKSVSPRWLPRRCSAPRTPSIAWPGAGIAGRGAIQQQDRIRTAADDAFAESLSRFRDNLGSAEQLLDESSQDRNRRNLAEMEEKLSDIKHQAIQDVFKSAEWYEKKAQTHIQNVTDKAGEQASSPAR